MQQLETSNFRIFQQKIGETAAVFQLQAADGGGSLTFPRDFVVEKSVIVDGPERTDRFPPVNTAGRREEMIVFAAVRAINAIRDVERFQAGRSPPDEFRTVAVIERKMSGIQTDSKFFSVRNCRDQLFQFAVGRISPGKIFQTDRERRPLGKLQQTGQVGDRIIPYLSASITVFRAMSQPARMQNRRLDVQRMVKRKPFAERFKQIRFLLRGADGEVAMQQEVSLWS